MAKWEMRPFQKKSILLSMCASIALPMPAHIAKALKMIRRSVAHRVQGALHSRDRPSVDLDQNARGGRIGDIGFSE
jgi:hypothetical protein